MLCRDLVVDPQTLDATILRPTHEVFGAAFPLLTAVSVYSTWRGVEGTYRLDEQLMNPEGDLVWCHTEAKSLVSKDRLMVHRIILHPLRMLIPEPGTYDFLLLANGEEVFRSLFNVVQQA